MKAFTCLLLFLATWSISTAQGICDPLVPEYCLLPFPNNFFTRADPKTGTGLRVVISDDAAPKDRDNKGFSMAQWSRLDGFSISSAIYSFFPNVSLEYSNVPGWQNLARSLENDCPTIILDTVTGERVAHWTELDHTTPETHERALMMWPTQQFVESRRYIVVIRNLKNENNQAITSSPAFAALRDGTPTQDPDIENRRDLYAEIFATLEQNGISKNEILLTWEFTVASEKYTTGSMFHMRDDATQRIPAGGPEYTIKKVEDNYSTNIFRRVSAEMTMPHYMTRKAMPGAELVLDENELPVYQGETKVDFTVAIPHKCTAAGSKCPVIVYGHGLLGTQDQVLAGTCQDVANTYGYIICGVDMWGMSAADVPFIAERILTDLGGINIIPDRSHQGMLNQLMLIKLMVGDFAQDPVVQFGGSSVIDTERKYYWGISQGGILGGVYLAMSEDIHKAHLGVPGAPYPLLLARSVDFDPYYDVIKFRYQNPVDRILILGFLGALWDRAEPSGYLNLIKRNPEKRALFDYALGDAQVTYLGNYFMVRSVGGKAFRGNVHCHNETTPIFGIEELTTTGPVTEGSVMVGFEYEGIGCGPIENIPPLKDTDTHGLPRNDERNKANMHSFFADGEIYDHCNGQGCRVP